MTIVDPSARVIPRFDPELTYSLAAFAEACGLKPQTVHNLRSTGGDLPKATKIRGRIYFRGYDIVAWLDSLAEPETSAES